MIYANIPQNIPQEQRAEINRSILASLKTSAKKLPAETVYNSYTGLGGLHGLDRNDFDSYNDYARAKKEFEMGQFFTPHDLCARMVALASPDPSEMVLDMCCGIGNFMNHLPNLYNAYGFDVDPDAVTVARYLYPQAHIEECDLRRYDPGFLFDLLLGQSALQPLFRRLPVATLFLPESLRSAESGRIDADRRSALVHA